MAKTFDITLDPTAIQQVVQKAILDQLNGEGRDKFLSVVLQSLATPGKKDLETGHQDPSPLQKAFNEACAVAARKVVSDEVGSSPEFIFQVQEKVNEAMGEIDKEDYTSYIADALREAMRRAKE